MSEINLAGKPDKFGIRDAIHVAVVSLKAACSMYAGDPVIWHEKGKSVKVLDSDIAPIGIVSAFMKGGSHEGDLVWIMLYPNTVTGMTHHWSHPDFQDEYLNFGMSLEEANSIIENMADSLDVYSYEDETKAQRLIEIASRYCKHQNGCWPDEYDRSIDSEDWENFWRAYSVLTGNPRPTENRVPFMCGC